MGIRPELFRLNICAAWRKKNKKTARCEQRAVVIEIFRLLNYVVVEDDLRIFFGFGLSG